MKKSLFIPFSKKCRLGRLTAANITDLYEFQGQLGKGGYGLVYKAKQKHTGQEVAIKVIDKKTV